MKKVIGIISIVLFLIVSLQSCVAGLGNAISDNGEIGGGAGIILALCMLIAGIILLASKTSKGMTITSIVFYTFGGMVGLIGAGSYKDLKIWSVLNLIFAILLILHLIRNKTLYKRKKEITE